MKLDLRTPEGLQVVEAINRLLDKEDFKVFLAWLTKGRDRLRLELEDPTENEVQNHMTAGRSRELTELLTYANPQVIFKLLEAAIEQRKPPAPKQSF